MEYNCSVEWIFPPAPSSFSPSLFSLSSFPSLSLQTPTCLLSTQWQAAVSITYFAWAPIAPVPVTSRASVDRDFLWPSAVSPKPTNLAWTLPSNPLPPPLLCSFCCSCSTSLFSWSCAAMKWALASSHVFLRSLCLFLSTSRSLFTTVNQHRVHQTEVLIDQNIPCIPMLTTSKGLHVPCSRHLVSWVTSFCRKIFWDFSCFVCISKSWVAALSNSNRFCSC